MSVIIVKDGRDPQDAIKGHPGYALVSIPIDLLIELEQELTPAPLADEPDHVLVIGNKTGGRRTRMRKECVWVIPPPNFP